MRPFSIILKLKRVVNTRRHALGDFDFRIFTMGKRSLTPLATDVYAARTPYTTERRIIVVASPSEYDPRNVNPDTVRVRWTRGTVRRFRWHF